MATKVKLTPMTIGSLAPMFQIGNSWTAVSDSSNEHGILQQNAHHFCTYGRHNCTADNDYRRHIGYKHRKYVLNAEGNGGRQRDSAV